MGLSKKLVKKYYYYIKSKKKERKKMKEFLFYIYKECFVLYTALLNYIDYITLKYMNDIFIQVT